MAAKKKTTKKSAKKAQGSKQEQIGFHKGALSTLAKERVELMRILGIVEQLMQMHVAGLKDLGVDLEKEAKGLVKGPKKKSTGKRKKKPIEDIL